MKKFALISLALAVPAVAGHYYLWSNQVQAYDATITANINKFNQEYGKDVLAFSYDKKETGGYPFSASVIYTNPKLVIEDSFYQSIADQVDTTYMVREFSTNGTVSLSKALLESGFSLESAGENIVKGIAYGEELHVKGTWDGVAGCSVALNDMLTDYLQAQYSGNAASNTVVGLNLITNSSSSLDCYANGVKTYDMIANRPLSELDAYHVGVAFSPSDQANHGKISVDMKVDGLVLRSDPKQYVDDLKAYLYPLSDNDRMAIDLLDKYPPIAIMDPARAGKQDIVLKGHYEGPLEKNMEAEFDIVLEQVELRNDLYQLSFPFSFRMGADKSMQFRHEGTFKATKLYDQLMEDSLIVVADMLQDDAFRQDQDMAALADALTLQTMRDLLPPYSEAGEIRGYFDVDIAARPTMVAPGSVNIKKAGFETGLFGLTMQGTMKPESQLADMTVICTHCDELLARTSRYANNINNVLYKMGHSPVSLVVTDPAFKALVGFIQSYDTDRSADTITMTIKNGADGQLALSGEPIGVVVFKALGALAPHFSQFQQLLMPSR